MKNGIRNINIVIVITLALTSILLFSGCICPVFSLFERSTGLKISAGDNIDDSAMVDELLYPGSIPLVQVNGDIERVLDLITTYGVSFSEEEQQAMEQLPESVKEQEVGAIVYSTPDSKDTVLSYYGNLTSRGWHIESFGGPGSGVQESQIIMAVKEDRRQALMVSGSENNSLIIFIDFDWDVLGSEEE